MKRHHLLVQLLAATLLLAGSACDDDNDPEPAEESIEEEACEHRADGPFQAVTAGATADATAPSATFAHTSVQITLADPDSDGTFEGFVTYAAAEAGDHVIFASDTVTLTVTALDGTPITVEAVEPVSLCSEVQAGHRVELTVGGYFLHFDASVAEVGVVIERDEAHAE
ncbi:MAG: hypothetical protein ACI9MR_002810 [Myxococcota bacterium]|jgi:hypothetical protein